MVVALACKEESCGVVARELTERKALHRMMIHEQQCDHSTGHFENIEEEFGLATDDPDNSGEDNDDAEESDSDHGYDNTVTGGHHYAGGFPQPNSHANDANN